MSATKPYSAVPIEDCQDPLVPIQGDYLVKVDPHPYAALGAPYGAFSPFFLRQGVLTRLQGAAAALQDRYPGWAIVVYDAYRPIPVQRFMVHHTFDGLAVERQVDGPTLRGLPEDPIAQEIWAQVHQFWALPSADPATPPPHSTGAAIDITLCDERGEPVDMGCPIDECSPRSFPNYFATATLPQERAAHRHRLLLLDLLESQGFAQHPNEWWHFSWGDQLWAWQRQQATARFGAIAPSPQ